MTDVRCLRLAASCASVMLAAVSPLLGQDHDRQVRPDSMDQVEHRVKRMREGAGLRVGSWMVSNLATPSGASSSALPEFEAYWQKGLDRHLAIETSAGLWHRQQSAGSGPSAETTGSFVIPLLTTIKLYPFTGPDQQLEPVVAAGVGFAMGLERQSTVTGGLLGGGSASSGVNLVAGFGLKGGAGLEYHFGRAFGISVGAAYQWVLYAQNVGGQSDYKGFGIFGGLTYRFQY
jgi:hypothetical protein